LSNKKWLAGAFPFLRRVFPGSMISGQLIVVSGHFGGAAMEGWSLLRRKDREALRERWLLRAGKAFERMFGKDNQEQLVTFTEREDMACLLGKELMAFLLEEHLAADGQVRPAKIRPPRCPKCEQPATRVTEPKADLPERPLTTRAGDIKLRREQWRCGKCRIVFFSAGPKAEAGDGGVQSVARAEGSAASEQGGVVQGRQ
jgi:hypothetical protein